MARKTRALEQRPAVDPYEEPSVEWGWHGSFPRGKVIGGIATIVILLLLIPGSYESRMYVPWILGIVAVILFLLVRDAVRRRTAWRR